MTNVSELPLVRVKTPVVVRLTPFKSNLPALWTRLAHARAFVESWTVPAPVCVIAGCVAPALGVNTCVPAVPVNAKVPVPVVSVPTVPKLASPVTCNVLEPKFRLPAPEMAETVCVNATPRFNVPAVNVTVPQVSPFVVRVVPPAPF